MISLWKTIKGQVTQAPGKAWYKREPGILKAAEAEALAKLTEPW